MDPDEAPTPAWRTPSRGEHRTPAVAVVVATVALQLLLPDELVIRPSWLLPSVTGLLVLALLVINPGRISRHAPVERAVALCLVAVVSAANGASAVQLVDGIITGSIANRPGSVLASAAIVYWSNIVSFSLWYWEFDGGGPGERAAGAVEYPDFLFPQMSDQKTAFSPTDVMPLRPWAKLTMMLQAAISLLIALLVVAWAIGALNSR
jgi:uncharacterized membrane protein